MDRSLEAEKLLSDIQVPKKTLNVEDVLSILQKSIELAEKYITAKGVIKKQIVLEMFCLLLKQFEFTHEALILIQSSLSSLIDVIVFAYNSDLFLKIKEKSQKCKWC